MIRQMNLQSYTLSKAASVILITLKSNLYHFKNSNFKVVMSIRDIFPIDKWDFKSQSVLADLPKEDLQLLTAHQSTQTYSKGEIIFREGAFPSGIFFIITGIGKK